MLIRHADPSRDVDGCLEIYGPFAAATPTSFEDRAPTLAEFADRIERIGRTHAFLVAEADGVVAGFAYAGSHRERPAYRWSTECSVYIGDAHRGQGLGRALYGTLLPLLERQGYRVALAGITLPNPASVGLHTALGFTEVGVYRRIGWKAGGWRDVVWLALALGPETTDDQEPAAPGAPVRLEKPVEL
jgi:phosphinothricin acetyltransferase